MHTGAQVRGWGQIKEKLSSKWGAAMWLISVFLAELQSSVGSVADLRTGGRWFYPRLGQYSFQGLMIIIATGFIPLPLLSVVSTMFFLGKQPVAWK